MAQAHKGQDREREQKYELSQFVKFIPADRTKSDVFRGKHFNIVVICVDDGYEIPPHHEPYDVFFYVISGKGVFTADEERWVAEPGSIIFAPTGVRGIKCTERMSILGIQEPHNGR